jgi:hypothetical protein
MTGMNLNTTWSVSDDNRIRSTQRVKGSKGQRLDLI